MFLPLVNLFSAPAAVLPAQQMYQNIVFISAEFKADGYLDQLSLPELPGLIAYSCASVSDILTFLVIISFHNQLNIVALLRQKYCWDLSA